MKSEHSKSEKKWNALLNWIFPFYACEMLEILKGIAYTSTERLYFTLKSLLTNCLNKNEYFLKLSMIFLIYIPFTFPFSTFCTRCFMEFIISGFDDGGYGCCVF